NRLDAMWTERKAPFSDHGPYLKKGEVIKTKGIYAVGPAPGSMESMPDFQSLKHTRLWLSQKHEKPFFLVQGINKPHLSFTVPQEFFDLYPLESIQLPETIPNDLSDIPPAAFEIFSRKDSAQFKHIRDYQDGRGWKLTMQAYLASISFSDWILGQIIDALEAGPHAKNTLIVLWSDHGYHLGEKEKLHKQTLWNQACHVPLIISLPEAQSSGTRCDAPVSLLDLYPTLNTLCQFTQAPPQVLDGHDLSPLLANPKATWTHPSITSHGPQNLAISDQRYRYIRYQDGSEELYDHKTDPHEFKNLAADPAMTSHKKRLGHMLPN
ncbi:sulfatase-like hydrolase/transferase, partial [Akkermansiaceae bacterium]|nr:sulfatase-like hydrolase/transferase [Akkermansiaceae bacterium]